jgi:hypothetical protein
VRALRKTDRAAADAVAKMRKPTLVAWALNTVARAHPKDVAALLDAGERLRAAQEKALKGDAGTLRAATEDRRKAVATLAARAAEALGERASANASAVSSTLEAATVDEDVAEALKAGRLDKERSAAAAGFGFGDVGDWTPPPKKAAPVKKGVLVKKAAPAERKKAPTLDKALAKAVAEAKERAAELHAAEDEERRLKQELAAATRIVRDARTRANKAELHAEQLRQRAWEEGDRRP